MIRAIYPGSFDPVTLGHLDIIRRASKTVNELIVGVLNNGGKTPLFSIDERVEMLREVTADIPNVKIMSFSGLLVDFARKNGATALVRGLRVVSDFEYEMQMALFNKDLCNELETVFFIADAEHSFISSSQVRNIASLGGSVEKYVTAPVAAALAEKYKTR